MQENRVPWDDEEIPISAYDDLTTGTDPDQDTRQDNPRVETKIPVDGISVLREILPVEMQSLRQWCCWGLVTAGDKQDKQPYSPSTGRIIKHDGTPAWVHNQCATFEEAALLVGQSEYEGVGFFATRSDPYMIIDLDRCLNPAIPTDELDLPEHLTKAAYKMVTSLPTYTERSMSGKGLHMIVSTDNLPAFFGNSEKLVITDKTKLPIIELFYASENYVALTGHSIFPITNEETNYFARVCPYSDGDLSYAVSGTTDIALNKETVRNVDEGSRDNHMYLYALQKLESGLSFDEVRALLDAENANCSPPLPRTQLDKCLESANRRFRSPDHQIENPPDYIENYNRFYFQINIRGKVYVIKEVRDHLGTPTIYYMTDDDFVKENAEHKTHIQGRKGLVQTARLWLEHPARRRYDYIVCEHGPVPPRSYNLWQGFRVNPKPGKCDKFFHHLRYNICDNDLNAYRYMIRWFARLIQQPTSPAMTAIALVGDKGTGKSILAQQFITMFGDTFSKMFSNSDRLTGKHNDYLESCCFLFLDEAFYAKSHKADGDLKAKITEKTFQVEAKFQPVRTVKNCLSILLATNNEHVLPYTQNERRYMTLNVTNSRIQDRRKYFTEFVEQMDNGGREALLYRLQHIDISNWDYTIIPVTEGSADQVTLSMDLMESWWYECLSRGWIIPAPKGEHPWSRGIAKTDFYNSYAQYHKENATKFDEKLTPIAFGMRFNKRFLTEEQNHTMKRLLKVTVTRYDEKLDEFVTTIERGCMFGDIRESKRLFLSQYRELDQGDWADIDPNEGEWERKDGKLISLRGNETTNKNPANPPNQDPLENIPF